MATSMLARFKHHVAQSDRLRGLLLLLAGTLVVSLMDALVRLYLIWATILGWLIFGDVQASTTVAGALVIFGGGVYVYRHAPIHAIGDPHNE